MVGVPTSNRCDNCRKRKKKCGEQRPSCAECIRSGWDCPGYPIRWKFMDESARLAKMYSHRKYVYDCDATSIDVIGPDETIVSSRKTSSDMFILEDFEGFSLGIPRFNGDNPLATKLSFCLGCRVKGDLVPLWLLGSFFQYVPGRLGRSSALDDAMSCICSIYCDRSSNEYTASKLICKKYVRALSSLRKCLADEYLRLRSETLCASLLLQMCELVVNVDKGKWGDLVRGTAQLIQRRGVERYKDPFDLGMLESQLSYIVVQSAKSEEDCYLRQSEWRALLTTNSTWPSDSITAKELKSLQLRIELCNLLFELPSVLRDVSSFQKRSGAFLSSFDPFLMDKILGIYINMKAWIHCRVEPHVVSDSFDLTGPQVKYPDMIAAIVDCVANTTLLALDKIICLFCHGNMPAHTIDTFDGPETVEGWYCRAFTAFEFVQSESTLAAKPLEIGLRQFQSSTSSPSSYTAQCAKYSHKAQ
ncbi:hypothetical protein SBOR_8667 [Sclerotinia borealis F-4128]|uniref:Zn(2)-C6 fungal-type domain-containing protein n=1 Tax=Sclerotinia borealis (strain F-4128) TaxID=1432307 RepID=W9C7U4_SCLBF|nr:hypothetical protein SBOR_8667 [Sclerotinia borealis F-4128]